MAIAEQISPGALQPSEGINLIEPRPEEVVLASLAKVDLPVGQTDCVKTLQRMYSI